jgi:parvulin-like peptidyl-prolyl isomerase
VALGELARLGLLRPYLRQQLISELVDGDPEPLSNEDSQAAFQAFAQERQIGSQEALDRYRLDQLLSPQGLEAQILRPLRLLRHGQRHFRPKAEARFLERKTELDRVVYSLLRLKDQGLARELFLRIDEDDASFADLAAAYAEGPEQSTRGIVGPVALTQAHPALADRLRTASPGQLLEPFRIEGWWVVVRLEQLTPAVFDQATASQMTQELLDQWINEEVERRLAPIRADLAVPAPQVPQALGEASPAEPAAQPAANGAAG